MYRRVGLGDTNTTACIGYCQKGGGDYSACIAPCCQQYPNDNICSNAAGTQDPSYACQYLGVGCDVRQTPPNTSAACAANPTGIACTLENVMAGAGGGMLLMGGALLLLLLVVRR